MIAAYFINIIYNVYVFQIPSECRLQMSILIISHNETAEHVLKAIHCTAVHELI